VFIHKVCSSSITSNGMEHDYPFARANAEHVCIDLRVDMRAAMCSPALVEFGQFKDTLRGRRAIEKLVLCTNPVQRQADTGI